MVPSLMPGSELVSTVTSWGPLPEAFEFASDSLQGPGLSAPATPSVAVEPLVSPLAPPEDEFALLVVALAPPPSVPVAVVPTSLEPLDDVIPELIPELVVAAPVVCDPTLVVPRVVPPVVGPAAPDVSEPATFPPLLAELGMALVVAPSFVTSLSEALQPPAAIAIIATNPIPCDVCTIILTVVDSSAPADALAETLSRQSPSLCKLVQRSAVPRSLPGSPDYSWLDEFRIGESN